MKKMSMIIMLFSFLLLMVSCIEEKGSNALKGARYDKKYLTSLSETNLAELANSHNVNCISNDCPSNIGRLFASDESGVYVCSAFLVEQDIMVTSSHCIPEDLKKSEQSDPLYVSFPKTGNFEKEMVSAKKLISFSKLDKARVFIDDNDYAFFQISKKVNRIPVEIDDQGVMDNEQVTIWKMDISNSLNDSYLTNTNCVNKHNSLMAPHANSIDSSGVFLSNCDISAGNSGSPVMNNRGNVSAILYGGKNQVLYNVSKSKISMLLKRLTSLTKSKAAYEIIKETQFALASSFRCICPPMDKYRQGINCQKDLPAKCNQHITEPKFKQLNTSLLEDFLSNRHFSSLVKDDLGLSFNIYVEDDNNLDNKYDVLFGFYPECIKDLEKFKKATTSREQVIFPECKAQMTVNNYFQLTDIASYDCNDTQVNFKIVNKTEDKYDFQANYRRYPIEKCQ